MPVRRFKEYLDDHGVHYEVLEHPVAYTAQEVAQRTHVPGQHFAKTVAIRIGDRLALAVLPATDRIDTERLAQSVGETSVRLASEGEFSAHFPGCETGAMPPFGNLYDMEVFVSPHLAQAEEIVVNAGTHTEAVRLPYSAFARLVKPVEVHM